MEKTGIVYFAKHVLGCGCDNSVFNSIEQEDHSILDCGVKLKNKIVIGERLMIYVADSNELRPDDVRNVITEGMNERDRKGYNRLRLAVVMPDVNGNASAYLGEFGCMPGKDDRTHIHIVSEDVMN